MKTRIEIEVETNQPLTMGQEVELLQRITRAADAARKNWTTSKRNTLYFHKGLMSVIRIFRSGVEVKQERDSAERLVFK